MHSAPGRAVLALLLALAAGCAGPKAPPSSMDRDLPIDGWLLVESPGLAIVSAGGEQRTLELVHDLQVFRAVARTLTHASVEPRVPMQILLFPNERAYAYYRPYRHVAGETQPSSRGFVLSMSADSPTLHQVLFHEYTHFLLFNQSPSYPQWYHEGFAEVLGSVSIREHVVTVGSLVGPRESTLIRADRLPPLEAVLGARSYQEVWKQLDGFYAQSWLLTHLLVLGEYAGYPRRTDSLRAYLARLQRSSDWRAAFDASFPEGLDALAKDLESYRQRVVGESFVPRLRLDARKLNGVETAVSLRPLAPADAAVELGAGYLDRGTYAARYAERVFERALERDPAHARAHAGLAEARSMLGDFVRASAELERAVSGAPDDAFVLRARGAVLLLQADSLREKDAAGADAARASAREVLRRAIALEPDVPEAGVLLGRSYLGAPGDAAEGVAALAAACAVLPWDDDTNLDLARLYLQTGQPGRALPHVERVLRWADGAALEQARALKGEIEKSAPGADSAATPRADGTGS